MSPPTGDLGHPEELQNDSYGAWMQEPGPDASRMVRSHAGFLALAAIIIAGGIYAFIRLLA